MVRSIAAAVVLAAVLGTGNCPRSLAAETAPQSSSGPPASEVELQRQDARSRRVTDLEQARANLALKAGGDPAVFQRRYVDLLHESANLLAQMPASARWVAASTNRLGHDYFKIATFTRFRLQRPDEALGLYAHASDLGSMLGRIGLADTYLGDFADRVHAIDLYRAASHAPKTMDAGWGGMNEQMDDAYRAFARHQVQFLETGKRFTGRLTPEDLADFNAVFTLMGEAMLMGDQLVPRSFVNEGPVQRLRGLRGHDLEAVLEPIPSSPLVMQAMMQVAPNVASVAQLNAFLSRHDPAGYWTACLFAIALYTEEESNLVRSRLTAEQREAAGSPPPTGRYSPVLFTAAHAFEPQRTITGIIRINPHLRSPTRAWDQFLGSLRRGRVEEALDCLTPELRKRFAAPFTAMTADQRRAAAQAFSRLTLAVDLGAFQEYAVTRVGSDGKRTTSMITFERRGPEWRISAM